MAEVASAFVTLAPSMKGFGRAAESQVSGEMKRSGSRIGGILGTSMKRAAGIGVATSGHALYRATPQESAA